MQSDKVVYLAERRREQYPIECLVSLTLDEENRLTFRVTGAGSREGNQAIVGAALVAAGMKVLGAT